MEKEFIPYELAIKLKELGFNETCFKLYRKLLKHDWYDLRSGGNIIFNEDEKIILSDGKISEYQQNLCSAPLWQQAFDWFREQYKMNPTVISYWQNDWEDFSYHYQYQLPDEYDSSVFELYEGKPCRTYEEARLECLKKLIEIIEDEK